MPLKRVEKYKKTLLKYWKRWSDLSNATIATQSHLEPREVKVNMKSDELK